MAGSLEAKLSEVRAASSTRLPAEILEMTAVLIAELEKTHVGNAVDVGDEAPDFKLKQAGSDASVTLSEAVKSGPVVVAFYRGQW